MFKGEVGSSTPIGGDPSPMDKKGVVRPEPEEVLSRRMKKRKGKAVIEVLIKWRGLGAEEASWVEYAEVAKEFPDLVGKVF